MSLSATIGETAAAIAPVLAAAAQRVRHHQINIHINGLPILLVIVLVIAGVVWVRWRSGRPNDGKG